MQKPSPIYYRILGIGCSIIIALLPFHAVLTAFFASRFDHFDLIRIWKEIILVFLCLISLLIIVKDKKLQADIFRNKAVRLGALYLLIIVIATIGGLIFGTVSRNASIYGIIIDTRFVLFLGVVCLAAQQYKFDWKKLILFPAAGVVIFGILQMTVLPKEFLTHFGYGKGSLLAFQNVDGKPSLLRVQSSLRGPNPFGAYIMVITILLISQIKKLRKQRWLISIFAILSVIVLYGSYSRSAWIGFSVALWCLFMWSVKDRKLKRRANIFTLCLILTLGAGAVMLRNNDIVQNMLFHTNEKSASPQSSNEQRSGALKKGVTDIYQDPIGKGVGSAGPASLRNEYGGRIAENYFLQLGQEAGIIGLGVFLAFLFSLGNTLWSRRSDLLPRTMLAIFVGLIFVNQLTHAWADDTLAYIFFGMIGIAIATTGSNIQKVRTKSENLAKI